MDEIKIFISYFSGDDRKVKIVKEYLENEERLTPIIIADKREPKKLLTEKVIEGIKSADYIIPILTEKSIHTQWINQEIGYSKALKKNIIPIVELEIINSLKGFIHKQIDLPYSFNRNSHQASENKSFKKSFSKLIEDLKSNLTQKSLSFKEKARLNQEEKKYQYIRKKFRESDQDSNVVSEANQQVEDLFKNIDEEIKQLEKENILFSMESKPLNTFHKKYVLTYEHNSIKLEWKVPFNNSLEDSFLIVSKFKGDYSISSDPHFINKKLKPKLKEEEKYFFDIDRNGNYCWTDLKTDKEIKIEKIKNDCFTWLVDMSSNESKQTINS